MSETSLPTDITSLYPITYSSLNNPKQKKATARIYDGLQRQINYFKKMAFKQESKEKPSLEYEYANTTEKTNTQAQAIIPKEWEDLFKGQKTEIDKVKKKVGHKKPGKQDFSKKLNESHNIFSKNLTSLKEMEKSLTEKKQADIAKITTVSKKEKSTFDPLYKDAKIELARLENNIVRYAKAPAPGTEELNNLFLRTRKDVPHYVIENALKASADKDIKREKNYNTLKAAIQETLFSCNEAEILGNKLEWPAEVLPKLNEYTAQLSVLNEQAKPILKVLDDLQTDIYSKKFEVKGTEKPDLKEFFANLKEWQAKADKLHDIESQLDDLDNSCFEFSKTMKTTLSEITSAISKLKENNDSLNDTVFKDKLDTQKKEAITAYTQLQEELLKKHNKLCLDLNALNISVTMFNKLINLVANITFTYEKAAMSYLEVRFTRLNEPLKENHQKVYNEQVKILEEIRQAIHTNIDYHFYKTTSLKHNAMQIPRDFQSCIIDHKEIKTAPDLKGQKAQLNDKTCNIILPASQTQAENLGLVWHAGKVKDAENLLTEQNQLFEAQLKLYKQKITEGFDTHLKDICEHLTYYINRVGQTLEIQTDKKNAEFNTAYPPESTTGKWLQAGALTIMGKGDTVTYGPYTDIKSPFDSATPY